MKTETILIVGAVVAIAGFAIYMQSQTKKQAAATTGTQSNGTGSQNGDNSYDVIADLEKTGVSELGNIVGGLFGN